MRKLKKLTPSNNSWKIGNVVKVYIWPSILPVLQTVAGWGQCPRHRL